LWPETTKAPLLELGVLITDHSSLTISGRKFELPNRTDHLLTKGTDMKKIIGSALIISLLAACQGTGDRQYDMPTDTSEAPTPSVSNSEQVFDTSTTGVQDSSTTIAHDTSAVRRQ
jgi:hypothetical protein